MKRILILAAVFSAGTCLGFSAKDTPYHILSSAGNTIGSDRLSLWPFAYHDNHSTAILWPLFSKSHDYLAVCPLYSQRGADEIDEFSLLWPLCQFNLEKNSGWILPFGWGKDYFTIFPLFWNTTDFQTLLPLYLYHHDSRRLFLGTGGLFGASWDRHELHSAWLLPLFCCTGDSFLSLPYHCYQSRHRTYEGSLGGIIGWTYEYDRLDSGWLFPLFYLDDSSFLSLPYFQSDRGWGAGCFLTGAIDDASWLFPLYYRDSQCLITPLFRRDYPTCHDPESLCIPPLLSRIEWDREGEISSWRALLGLAGYHRGGSHWALPFYHWSDAGFSSLGYGDREHNGTRTTWWGLPLFGLHRGRRGGHWLFPLYNYQVCSDFDDLKSHLDDTVLADEFRHHPDLAPKPDSENSTVRPLPPYACAGKSAAGLIGIHDETIRLGVNANQPRSFQVEHSVYHLLPGLHYHHAIRNLSFDPGSRKKLGERRTQTTRLLTVLYRHQEATDTFRNTRESDSSVLWRLWKRHEQNGDVATDIFPGISLCQRSDGYSRTSFFWKLYNYESDPEDGSHLDLFFIRCW